MTAKKVSDVAITPSNKTASNVDDDDDGDDDDSSER